MLIYKTLCYKTAVSCPSITQMSQMTELHVYVSPLCHMCLKLTSDTPKLCEMLHLEWQYEICLAYWYRSRENGGNFNWKFKCPTCHIVTRPEIMIFHSLRWYYDKKWDKLCVAWWYIPKHPNWGQFLVWKLLYDISRVEMMKKTCNRIGKCWSSLNVSAHSK